MFVQTGEVETALETKLVEWRIPYFSAEHNFGYESPSFSSSDHLWKVRLCRDITGNILVDIWPSMKREYSLEYYFGLKRYDGSVEYVVNGILESDEICPWLPLIEKSKLLQRQTELMRYYILTVICTLKNVTKISHSVESAGLGKVTSLKLTRLDKLSEDFKDLFEDKESCDVVLKVQDRQFKAHRSVLMARSNVFAADFKHNTLEQQTGVITISDCDPDSFEIFLEYLYCGENQEFSFPNTLNLYFTSRKYEVDELKAFCVEYLIQNLTVENVCEIAIFANNCEETQLFSAVQNFFNQNSCKILETSEWEYLMQKHYHLAHKLLREMEKVKFRKCVQNLY